jgi:hypothetical protein
LLPWWGDGVDRSHDVNENARNSPQITPKYVVFDILNIFYSLATCKICFICYIIIKRTKKKGAIACRSSKLFLNS